jgi:hypothetical protein
MFQKKDPLRASVDAAQSRLEVCQKGLDRAIGSQVRAKQKLDASLGEVHKAKDDLDKLRASYSANPTDALGKKISAAREAVDLAELRASKPRAALVEADKAVQSASVAVLDAERELAAATRLVRIEELKKTASLDSFREDTADGFKRLLVLRREMAEVASAIDARFHESRDASLELVSEGVDCPEAVPLSPVLLLAPFVEDRIKKCPGAAVPIAVALRGSLAWLLDGKPGSMGPARPAGIAPCMSVLPLDAVNFPGSAESSPLHAKALEAYFSTRQPEPIDNYLNAPEAQQ